MNNKIYVVTHKDYKMPKDDLYQAIAVGDKKKITSPTFSYLEFFQIQYSAVNSEY